MTREAQKKSAKSRSAAPSEKESLLAERHKQIGFLLRRLYQRNQSIWQSLSTDDQVTSVQSAALGVLLDEGPCSLTELGSAASMDPATTRGVVDRLRARKMISLKRDSTDKRKVIVHLEKDGRSFLEAMNPVMPRIADETLSPLNEPERLAFEFLLRKIVESNPDLL